MRKKKAFDKYLSKQQIIASIMASMALKSNVSQYLHNIDDMRMLLASIPLLFALSTEHV